ncbi:MAG: diacylglycerol kinase [Paracoccaceae bacterium]
MTLPTNTKPPNSTSQNTKPPRKSGLAHFLAAASYSAGGLRRLARESAFRQEAVLGVVVLGGLALWGASGLALVGAAALVLLLIAVEALNTALEVLVDHLSPDWSQFAKDAKDLGSLAVACTIGALGLYVLGVLIWG